MEINDTPDAPAPTPTEPTGNLIDLPFGMDDIAADLQRKQTPITPPPVVVDPTMLDKAWDEAMLGITISADHSPRFVYSLEKMTTIVMRETKELPDEARKTIWNLILRVTRDHGTAAPIFVDDAISASGGQSSIIGMDGKPVS